MADEKTAQETTPAPEPEKPASPPLEIDITEIEALKLMALQATGGKLMAELQLLSLKVNELQKEISMRQQTLPQIGVQERELLAEIAERLGLKDINQYSLDLVTQKGHLRPAQKAPPPRG